MLSNSSIDLNREFSTQSIGHSNGGCTSDINPISLGHCRRRKARTVFSDSQLAGLEKHFSQQKYLSTPERMNIATSLNLTESQVSATYEEAS